MPKTKFQGIIFGLIMSITMAYGMEVYNVALKEGGLSQMTNRVFWDALLEAAYMWIFVFFFSNLWGNRIGHKLAALIFHDAKAKKAIESLIFPRVLESYKAFSIHEAITIAEIPLLYEAQMDKYFDHVLVLSSKQKVALERLKKRGLNS